MQIQSFAEGSWVSGKGSGKTVYHAVTGEPVGDVSSEGLNFKAMLDYGRTVGGPNLRALTFHERALRLKALA
jgi:oxepin-CoA hydrolase/3-oxo-5,6-dehydrosuberyl-CoA semialdehyde dehydrogenase